MNGGTLKRDHRPGFTVLDFDRQQITAFSIDRNRIVELMSIALNAGDERQVWANTQAFDSDWEPVVLY